MDDTTSSRRREAEETQQPEQPGFSGMEMGLATQKEFEQGKLFCGQFNPGSRTPDLARGQVEFQVRHGQGTASAWSAPRNSSSSPTPAATLMTTTSRSPTAAKSGCNVSRKSRDRACRSSKIGDGCVDLRRSIVDVSTFGDRCVDFRRSMCRPSEMDVLTFEDR